MLVIVSGHRDVIKALGQRSRVGTARCCPVYFKHSVRSSVDLLFGVEGHYCFGTWPGIQSFLCMWLPVNILLLFSLSIYLCNCLSVWLSVCLSVYRMGSTKSVHALQLDTGFTASGPIFCPRHTIVTCIQGPCSSYAGSPVVSLESVSSH